MVPKGIDVRCFGSHEQHESESSDTEEVPPFGEPVPTSSHLRGISPTQPGFFQAVKCTH